MAAPVSSLFSSQSVTVKLITISLTCAISAVGYYLAFPQIESTTRVGIAALLTAITFVVITLLALAVALLEIPFLLRSRTSWLRAARIFTIALLFCIALVSLLIGGTLLGAVSLLEDFIVDRGWYTPPPSPSAQQNYNTSFLTAFGVLYVIGMYYLALLSPLMVLAIPASLLPRLRLVEATRGDGFTRDLKVRRQAAHWSRNDAMSQIGLVTGVMGAVQILISTNLRNGLVILSAGMISLLVVRLVFKKQATPL